MWFSAEYDAGSPQAPLESIEAEPPAVVVDYEGLARCLPQMRLCIAREQAPARAGTPPPFEGIRAPGFVLPAAFAVIDAAQGLPRGREACRSPRSAIDVAAIGGKLAASPATDVPPLVQHREDYPAAALNARESASCA
jgi:hypothetical protein